MSEAIVVNTLFGLSVRLPSIPGAQSGIENELLQLLKEVDLAFTTEQTKLLKELNDVKSLCNAQNEEIIKLREIIQSDENASGDAKQFFYSDFISKHKQLEAEIDHLTIENEQLRSQLAKYNPSSINKEEEANVPSDVISLQAEVHDLKTKLKKAEFAKLFYEAQYEKLSKISSRLQEIMSEEKEKEEILAHHPEIQEHTEDIVLTAFKKAMAKEQVDIKKFEKELKHEIMSCFENVIPNDK